MHITLRFILTCTWPSRWLGIYFSLHTLHTLYLTRKCGGIYSYCHWIWHKSRIMIFREQGTPDIFLNTQVLFIRIVRFEKMLLKAQKDFDISLVSCLIVKILKVCFLSLVFIIWPIGYMHKNSFFSSARKSCKKFS